MSGPYDDILNLPHHVSSTRRRMSMIERAAQFSPFAALTGYDAAIQETARLTDDCLELDTDGMAMLDEKIRRLSEAERPEITVTYFVPDQRKSGGAYVTAAGRVQKVDPMAQTMVMTDGTQIAFRHIRDLSGKIFEGSGE